MANSLTESRRKIILNSPHIASASGSIVTINDAIKAKLKSCVVDISPVQEGTGDPSPDNIRPISGWTECNIAYGDNFYNSAGTVSHIAASMNVTIISKNEIVVTNLGRSLYPASKQNTSSYNLILNDKYVIKTHIKSKTNDASPRVAFRNQDNSIITFALPDNDDIKLFFDATQQIKNGFLSFFSAYNATGHQSVDFSDIALQRVVNISFPSEAGTVYKGKLDVINGVLTVTHIGFDMGSSNRNWSMDSNTSLFYTFVTNMKVISYPLSDISNIVCCSSYKPGFAHSLSQIRLHKVNGSIYIQDGNTKIYIYDTRFTTAEDFKEANVGQTLVVQLATPITYQLTPIEMQMILGTNTILADTGNTSVKYWAHS